LSCSLAAGRGGPDGARAGRGDASRRGPVACAPRRALCDGRLPPQA